MQGNNLGLHEEVANNSELFINNTKDFENIEEVENKNINYDFGDFNEKK